MKNYLKRNLKDLLKNILLDKKELNTKLLKNQQMNHSLTSSNYQHLLSLS